MKHTKEFAAKRAILEAHAAQLRADVIRELYDAGEEWTALLTEKIDELMESDKSTVALVGKLTEIGFTMMLLSETK